MADILTEKLESFKSFRVDAYCEGYPDVIFEIILDAVPTREQTEIAVKALEKFVYTYNIFHFCDQSIIFQILTVCRNKCILGEFTYI